MLHPRNCAAVRQFSLVAVLAVAGILLAAGPAPAQIWIAHDRSIVRLPRAQPFPVGGSFVVNPVVVGGNRYVRVSGSYSAAVVNPNRGYPGTGFVMPQSAADRARAANFNGTSGPVVVGPWQKWW